MSNIVHKDQKALGIAIMLAAAFVLTATDAAVKWAVADYSVIQVNFFRGIFAILVLGPLLLRKEGFNALKTTRPTVHIVRSALLIVVSFVWFYTLRFMKLADAGALVMMAPIFITALSAPLLGERVGGFRWAAVLIGFFGMLFIVRPGTGVFQSVSLLAVLVALGYALFMISNRAYRNSETLTALIIYPQIAVLLAATILVPWFWKTPTLAGFVVMAIAGLCAGLGHLLLTLAFRYAPPSILAPLDYTALIWAIGMGYLFFSELPDRSSVAGMALITTAGLAIVFWEGVHRKTLVEDV